MTKRIVLGTALALGVFLVASCVRPDPEADRSAVQSLVERDSVWFQASTTVDSAGTGGYFADGDTAVIWWRGTQTHDQPALEVQVNGDSAWVDWSRHNFGQLYVLAKPPETTLVLWTKNLVETAQLRGIFTRTGKASDVDRGWKLDKVSLAFGQSDSGNTVVIDSLRIESSSVGDVLVHDPLNTYYGLADLISFTPGEQVTITLYTNVEEGMAFLHTFVFVWPFYLRLPFTNSGVGVYTGTWNAQMIAFPRFAIFDLVARSTIYSPTGPYDFTGWLLPYNIRTAD